MKVRDLLNEYEFPGDDTPIIRGSALKALEDPQSPWGDKILETAGTEVTTAGSVGTIMTSAAGRTRAGCACAPDDPGAADRKSVV